MPVNKGPFEGFGNEVHGDRAAKKLVRRAFREGNLRRVRDVSYGILRQAACASARRPVLRALQFL